MAHPLQSKTQNMLHLRWYPMTNIPVIEPEAPIALLLEADRAELEQQTLQKVFALCHA